MRKTISRFTSIYLSSVLDGGKRIIVPSDINVFRASFNVSYDNTLNSSGIIYLSNIPINSIHTPGFTLPFGITRLLNTLVLDRRGEGIMSDELYIGIVKLIEPLSDSIKVEIMWEGFVKEGKINE